MSWGNPTTPLEKLRKTVLAPASLAYLMGSYCRLEGYRTGLLKREQQDVPVLSVGNITCGGTGKTPITIDLAKRFIAAGIKVGILSRGYKRQSQKQTVVVSDGAGHYATCEESGDEPYLIAKRLPKAVVLVGANRRASASLAVSHYGCQLLILDDGFQHFPLRRDVDLVLIDYNDEPSNDSLLPSGRLREPLKALSRATSLVITKIPENYDAEKIERLQLFLKGYVDNKPIDKCSFVASHLVSQSCVLLPVDALKGNSIVAVSALARPEPFHSLLREKGANIIKSLSWTDHHWYSDEDMQVVENAAQNAAMIITTEKDLVKMKPSDRLAEKLYALRIETNWLGTPPQVISEVLAKLTTSVDEGVRR
ncbi:MAG: tetraacyldisaccharide 4'-kinase [Cyanobacteria bacterium SZAS-4]|nr:tetraacyldisaccharide 4'-kinase [Cyanobacteria bacterium SZAS-4]